MVKIRRSNLVTSASAWFSPSSRIISATSWMLDTCYAKSTTIYLQETFIKHSDKLNIKTFEQYEYIIDIGQRAPGGVSILIRKDIPQNKININTHLQAIAITICSLYIPPHDPIKWKWIKQSNRTTPSTIYLDGRF